MTDPSPEEIAEATARIRATWSEAERLRRLQWVPDFPKPDRAMIAEAEAVQRAKRSQAG